jgi:uncharacterized Zn-binding protein involved in type VI secretion
MPPVARKGDAGVPHCSGYVLATASDDVFVNSRGAVRVGDQSTTHLRPASPCVPHTSTVFLGSASVFVNNRSLARVGDPLTACTQIAQGSPDVLAGG